MPTSSWLPEGFERLERIPGRPRIESGSPVGLLIEMARPLRETKTIFAIGALAHRGMNLLRAKRSVEAMMYEGKAYVYVPKVESIEALIQELADAGVKATALPAAGIDVCSIRDKLGLTQEQFAVRYGLDVDAVRNWETGRRTPDTAAQSYLRAIRANPEAVEAALWSDAAAEERRATPTADAPAEARLTPSAA